MKLFILTAPGGLMDFKSLSSTCGAAQSAVVGSLGDDGRFHSWGWWRARGWRCRRCEVMILSAALDTNDEE